MKRFSKDVIWFVAALLTAGLSFGQSSTQGGGLSTKAILALEQCFDEMDTFVCATTSGSAPVGGSGTLNTIAKFTPDGTTLGDSQITDDGTDVFIQSSGSSSGWLATGPLSFLADDQIVFQTTSSGHLIRLTTGGNIEIDATDSGDVIIESGNSVGNTVQLGGDLASPTVTLNSVTQSTLNAIDDGGIAYCSDCNPDATCTSGGTGAFAFRINGAWACAGGGVGGSGTLNTIAKFTPDGTTLGDSIATDDGSEVTFAGNIIVQEGVNPGIDLSDYGDNSFVDEAIRIGRTGYLVWEDGGGDDAVAIYGTGAASSTIAALNVATQVTGSDLFRITVPANTSDSGSMYGPQQVVENGCCTANTLDVQSSVMTVASSPATTVDTITCFGSGCGIFSSISPWLTIVCQDADLTLTDTDAATDDTMDLDGDFVCAGAGDLITLVWIDNLAASGVDKWYEVSRSVNTN